LGPGYGYVVENKDMTCGYTYDDDGLLTNVDGLALQRNVPNGLLTGTTLGSVTDTYTYNSFGEVSNYTAAYPAGLSCQIGYTRDAVGRITMGFGVRPCIMHRQGFGVRPCMGFGVRPCIMHRQQKGGLTAALFVFRLLTFHIFVISARFTSSHTSKKVRYCRS